MRRWWVGEFVMHENDPASGLYFVNGWQRRHWTARTVDACWRYFRDNHQWIIGTVLLGLVAIYVGAKFGK
jgi:hypothetical protein